MITVNDLLTIGFKHEYSVNKEDCSYECYTYDVNGITIDVTFGYYDKKLIIELTQNNGFSELKISDNVSLLQLINLLK